MKYYQKKPVVIEAFEFNQTFECYDELDKLGMLKNVNGTDNDVVLKIETLEGTMTAKIGDMIIKGVNGEFYPCKPDIFVKTYEEFSMPKVHITSNNKPWTPN